MTLYEMTEAAKALYAMFDNEEIDEKTVNDTLEGMGVELKLEDCCKVIRQLNADAEQLAAEAARMNKKKAQIENNINRLETTIKNYFDVIGKTNEKAGIFTVKISESKAANIVDKEAIPKEFLIEQPPKVDKASIRKLLLKGETVSGAELQINKNVQIK